MQATVSTFDPLMRSGHVLLDDGVELPFAAEAIDGTGIRLLRSGQRVRLETSGEGPSLQVVKLHVITLS